MVCDWKTLSKKYFSTAMGKAIIGWYLGSKSTVYCSTTFYLVISGYTDGKNPLFHFAIIHLSPLQCKSVNCDIIFVFSNQKSSPVNFKIKFKKYLLVNRILNLLAPSSDFFSVSVFPAHQENLGCVKPQPTTMVSWTSEVKIPTTRATNQHLKFCRWFPCVSKD